MTALSIQPTFPIFTETDGQPLEDGYIWIGTANLDPQGNPISVYWDAALTQLAGQPIRTQGGYPVNSGTPARLYVNSDYSIRVMNKNGSTVYSAPAATERYNDVVINVDSSNVTFLQAGIGAVTRSVQSRLRDTVSVKDFGAVGDGVTDDTAAIQAALTQGKFVFLPQGTYLITAPIDLKTYAQAGLIGESYMLTKIKAGAAMTSVIDLYDTTDIYAGIAEYKIYDIDLDGDSLATYGMHIRYRHQIDARGVRVEGCDLAFWMADSWMCNFWDCYSHFNENGGFHLEGANHSSTYNQCHVTGANTGPAVYVGGTNRIDGNSDITFNNLLIDACDFTQIVVEMGVNSNVVTFNGGYMGEYAANSLGTSAFVKAISGKATLV